LWKLYERDSCRSEICLPCILLGLLPNRDRTAAFAGVLSIVVKGIYMYPSHSCDGFLFSKEVFNLGPHPASLNKKTRTQLCFGVIDFTGDSLDV